MREQVRRRDQRLQTPATPAACGGLAVVNGEGMADLFAGFGLRVLDGRADPQPVHLRPPGRDPRPCPAEEGGGAAQQLQRHHGRGGAPPSSRRRPSAWCPPGPRRLDWRRAVQPRPDAARPRERRDDDRDARAASARERLPPAGRDGRPGPLPRWARPSASWRTRSWLGANRCTPCATCCRGWARDAELITLLRGADAPLDDAAGRGAGPAAGRIWSCPRAGNPATGGCCQPNELTEVPVIIPGRRRCPSPPSPSPGELTPDELGQAPVRYPPALRALAVRLSFDHAKGREGGGGARAGHRRGPPRAPSARPARGPLGGAARGR